MELTKEQISQAVAEAMAEEIKKLQEPVQKFQPGEPSGVQVTLDEADQKFASLGEQLMAVRNAYEGGIMDPRLRGKAVRDDGVMLKATGLSESVPADGGFLVEQEFVPRLLARVWETGLLVGRVDKQQGGR